MFMIAVIVVCGILYGALVSERMTLSGHMALSAEERVSEREQCYKLPELRVIGIERKFAVSDRFIHGVLRQGLCGIDAHGRKKELNGLNDINKYVSKNTEKFGRKRKM